MADHKRILTFKDGFNFRELGGYQTANNETIAYHKLVRSAHLAYFERAEQQALYDYGIRTVIDFRSSSEVALYPDQLDARIKYLRIPVFDNDITESNDEEINKTRQHFSQDPQAGFKRMMHVYHQFVIDEQAQGAFHRFMQTLCAVSAKGGVIFHCSAGKDRTGLAAVYLLSILGVPEQTIYQDYILTNRASVKRIKERLRFGAKAGLGENYLRSIYDLSTANKHYYDQALSLINANYGGMQAYLRDVLQISTPMIEQLKYLYLQK
ncbi:tyrosine-protein phosphatase [Limosilactobacillus kribbianus]|jgi:protein-tyrosine phosphatase|uniref:tyrosine-protein phosphatase n=1 Tax=Limosilactobacillus kribbianus TaxID=2982695 RepID=UPI0022654F34|nr:tyrosine-protein phosphatase [Limosilactobacillus kribbianus]